MVVPRLRRKEGRPARGQRGQKCEGLGVCCSPSSDEWWQSQGQVSFELGESAGRCLLCVWPLWCECHTAHAPTLEEGLPSTPR